MAALTAGVKAPDIFLPTIDDKKFSLRDALQRGPVLAAFFKVSCPICQYTFPFIERLYKAYGGQKVTIVGVSQDSKADTKAFLKEYGITFPVCLDDPKGYSVSNAYGLTNVPTMFLIMPDGEVELSSVGWVKQDMEQLNRRLAELEQTAPRSLFKPGDDVRDFRAG